MHVHTYTYPHTLHTQENYSQEEAQRWMEHRNVALSEMSLSLSPLLKTLLFELLPTWISGRLCTLIEGSQACLHACVYTILHGSVHGQGEQAPLRPDIWGTRGARAILQIFFGDLMTHNLQRAARAVRRVTKETGGGCTLAPMSQSRVLIL